METFAIRLKKRMAAIGMSQKDLVQKMGISQATASRYMSGALVPKDIRAYENMAECLKCDPHWLRNGEDRAKGKNRVSIEDAAKAMGKSREFVKAGLKFGTLPIGVAIEFNSGWSYYISPKLLREYIGEYE